MKTTTIYILFALTLLSCSCTVSVGPEYYVSERPSAMGKDINELELGKDGYFKYTSVNSIYGRTTGIIQGTWKKSNDSLFLTQIFPVDFKIKKSFVSYSNIKSSDSIYFLFYNLYPEIIQINRYLYREVSISLFENCKNDTCPAPEFMTSICHEDCFGDTIAIPRNSKPTIETINFFDPNDVLIDKSIRVTIGTNNCIRIYLARKPKYDFIEIPLKYRISKSRSYIEDFSRKTKYFRKAKKIICT